LPTVRSLYSLLLGCILLAGGGAAEAGTISIEWDPIPGAQGYRVHYGSESGNYSKVHKVGNATSTTIKGLSDCTTWYLAVRAHNGRAESVEFSNEISGWPRPEVRSAGPRASIQGSRLTLEILGTNFQPGATVEVDNPHVSLDSAVALSCKRVQVSAAIEPTAPGVRAAEVGRYAVTVSNPDNVFGAAPDLFEVRVDPARFDLDHRSGPSEGRLDGRDTIWLSRYFGTREGQADHHPDPDFNGDGWVDGIDLAYLASDLGKCWDGEKWSLAACAK
jgi:hypothetical protein